MGNFLNDSSRKLSPESNSSSSPAVFFLPSTHIISTVLIDLTALKVSLITPGCITFGIRLLFWSNTKFEPRHEKTGFLHMRKQRRRSASR